MRVIKFSIQDIFRNIWLSLVTVIILILALFTVNMLLIVKVIGETAVNSIKEKIDINLFLTPDATDSQAMILKSKIDNLAEVKTTTYISKKEALKNFREKHQNNPEIISALKELGSNPLTPSITIKPRDLNEFDNLTNKLNTFDDKIIESKNFTDYKALLDKINLITKKVSDAALFLSLIFIFITLLVVYNSVRVAIYTHRREITIMRLVGASKWFIQMPYLISSIIYTLAGIIAVIFIFFPFLSLLQPYMEAFFVGYNINLIDYFLSQSLKIFGTQFLAAAAINVLASLLAVRKYSKV